MLSPELEALLLQAGRALAYYVALIVIMRLAGKRLAGQTTTFDLVVLITLGVVLQSSALQPGFWNAIVFVGTVFVSHRTLARACAHSTWLRHLVRGKPRRLIRDGKVLPRALELEGISEEELLAGLRKLGYAGPEAVRTAMLEETGHISAVARDA